MELLDPIDSLLKVKGYQVWSVGPDAFVYEAIELMAQKRVGVLLVLSHSELVGIISERDYARKVILEGKSSKETEVREIMTTPVISATPQSTVAECMRVLTANNIRHLPVVENGKVLGVVSLGDLVKWIITAQAEMIQELGGYFQGPPASW
ncbi:MAG: histidine kinase [Acidobacteria bacterium RIFCSPLOWO2_02_FULL_59_13]|nr:MAG: histidine kinase [Acidobacteria bacterium RIFCSPLOWO2_02_FULL_59_13]